MVANNTLSNRHFKPKPNTTPWQDTKPNFGIIKGLHLEFLEFAHKIKKNAPLIPEPQYSGKAFDDPKDVASPPPPSSQSPQPIKSNHQSPSLPKSISPSASSSSSSDGEYEEDKDFLDKFGTTPDKQSNKKSSKYIPVSKPEIQEDEDEPETLPQTKTPQPKEKDPTETYIEEEVERRSNIIALKKAKLAGLDVGNIEDDMDLQTTRILRKTADGQASHNKSVSMNRFALMGIFLGVDQGFNIFTDKMKGYFQYQMDVMHIYDDYLDAIGESSINAYLQSLDPTLQLAGMICLTTGGFYIFQNFVGEDKVKGAKLIKSFFPAQAQTIDDITNASKKVKEEKKQTEATEAPKKRRGPSYKAEDINRAE
jgi:hypothetical protein